MAQRIGKYKVSKREAEVSLRDGGVINGDAGLTYNKTTNHISGSADSTGSFGHIMVGNGSGGDKLIKVASAGGANSSIRLMEGTGNNGFSLLYDGDGNQFSIRGHDNSAGGSQWLMFERDTGAATFAGTLNSGVFTSTGNIVSTGASAKISGSSTSTGSFGRGYIDNKLGIGTKTPDQLLHAEAADDVYLKVKATGANSTSGIIVQNDARTWLIRNEGGDSDKFQLRDATADAQRLTVDSLGKVGLETTSPDAHLHISSSGALIGSSTASLHIEGSGSEVVAVDGTQGRLFSVTDEMSGSIFSANTIAGLPVIEAFSDNKVNLGPFSSPIQIDSSGNISGSSTSTG